MILNDPHYDWGSPLQKESTDPGAGGPGDPLVLGLGILAQNFCAMLLILYPF